MLREIMLDIVESAQHRRQFSRLNLLFWIKYNKKHQTGLSHKTCIKCHL